MLESHELRREGFGDGEFPFTIVVFSEDEPLFGKLGLLSMVFGNEAVSSGCEFPFCVDLGSLIEVGEAGWDLEWSAMEKIVSI